MVGLITNKEIEEFKKMATDSVSGTVRIPSEKFLELLTRLKNAEESWEQCLKLLEDEGDDDEGSYD